MKQLFSLIGIIFLSLASFGAQIEPEIKITSFTSANTRLAELCGQVIHPKTIPTFIQVAVDPRGNHPANYNTLAGKDGQFCLTVITYTGEAEAHLM